MISSAWNINVNSKYFILFSYINIRKRWKEAAATKNRFAQAAINRGSASRIKKKLWNVEKIFFNNRFLPHSSHPAMLNPFQWNFITYSFISPWQLSLFLLPVPLMRCNIKHNFHPHSVTLILIILSVYAKTIEKFQFVRDIPF